ncbi:GNAT family N-acetyltransferase [Inquilinus limosus]|uniref:GNAT family N-acetyltransferase n=1 Tax=Inquilinus limosus TaxID=171674 RepID=UPI003F141D01
MAPALPSFETPRLILRPRTMADLEDCLAMDRDPEVVRHIDGPWSDPEAHRRFVEDRITRTYPDGMGYWTVRAKAPEGRFLGWVLLIPADAVGPEIEIGWRLVRAAWGHGYATEAAAPILAHARETLGVTVIADIDPGNTASIRVAEKIGMHRLDPAGTSRSIRYSS